MMNPLDVVHATLLEPVPCAKCSKVACRCMFAKAGRLKNQAAMIVEALTAAGLLHVEQAAPTEQDFEQLAQALAEWSQHPRYVLIDDGWRKLLESEADVSVAYNAAQKAISGPSAEQKTKLGRAHDALVAHIRQRRAAERTGA